MPAARKTSARPKRQAARKPPAAIVPIASRGESKEFQPRDRSREVILNAALRLYGREGYAAVTMRALAQEIGCSAGSIYNYFLDKHEIFSVLQDQGLRVYSKTVVGVTAPDPVDAVREFFRRYYEFSHTHPAYFTLLWVDHAVPAIAPTHPDMELVVSESSRLVQRCVDEGVFPKSTNIAAVIRVLWGAVLGSAVLQQLPHIRSGARRNSLALAALDLALASLRAGALLPAMDEASAVQHPRVDRPGIVRPMAIKPR